MMNRFGSLSGVLLAALLVGSCASLREARVTRDFAILADEGAAPYRDHCAACHGEALEGVGVVPALTGLRFDQSWRGKSAEVLAFHVERMPPGRASAEPRDEGVDAAILAYLLTANDVAPVGIESAHDGASIAIPTIEGQEADPLVPVVKTSTQQALLAKLPSVTRAMLLDPSPTNWIHWGRTYDGQTYSPLSTINRTNVHRMEPVFRAPLIRGTSMPMPLVLNGVMFLQTYPDTVVAMDATTGSVLWRYRREGLAFSSKKMGLSLHEDRVYVATSDLHVVALDSRTGAVVWDHSLDLGTSPETRRRYHTRSAPLVAGDVVIQGTLSFRMPKGSNIIGIDRESGEEAWRFNTVAWPGQPGGNTWNGLDVEARNGGSIWQQGTYDPALNLIYYGVAPTYDTAPLLVPSGEPGVTNEAMYTNCTVALEADTGKLAWYYQHTQNDQWDMDWAFERTIVDLPDPSGGTVRAVMNVGKNAMLDVLEAATGRFLFSLDLGVQNVITAVDPVTGAKTIDPRKMPNPDSPSVICPIPFGARAWPQTSYSPATGYLYVPITESCFEMSETGKGGRLLTTGVGFGPAAHPGLDDGMMGRLQAIDLGARKLAWNTDQVTPQSTGLLATAGGLVFSGSLEPSLKAFDDTTGEVLWSATLDDLPSSSLISYEVDGRQYLAVVVGMMNNWVRDITNHYRAWSKTEGKPGDRGGAALWVFALPEES